MPMKLGGDLTTASNFNSSDINDLKDKISNLRLENEELKFQLKMKDAEVITLYL